MGVKVELLDMVSPDQLELTIQKYLDAGYFIQDSKLDMYQNTVSAVYVFVKKKKENAVDDTIYYDELGNPLPF